VDEDIVSACIASNAHDFIKTFPQGYETDVDKKQRISSALDVTIKNKCMCHSTRCCRDDAMYLRTG
jgi:hypothetical protein